MHSQHRLSSLSKKLLLCSRLQPSGRFTDRLYIENSSHTSFTHSTLDQLFFAGDLNFEKAFFFLIY